jgi:hypothetical protein
MELVVSGCCGSMHAFHGGGAGHGYSPPTLTPKTKRERAYMITHPFRELYLHK